jgi:uncharacterized protein
VCKHAPLAQLEEDTVANLPAGPTLRALRERRAEILALAERRRARNVRVFGSVGRGDAGADSDIDILVDMDPNATLIDLIGLEQDLSELLGRRVDVVTEDGVSPLMRENPTATAVRI